MRHSRTLAAWATGGLFTLLIVVIVQIDNGQSPALLGLLTAVPYFDKVLHFSLYGLLAFGLDIATAGARWRGLGRTLSVAMLMVMAAGTLEELTQFFIPSRTPDLVDWLCTCLGALSGARCARAVRTKAPV